MAGAKRLHFDVDLVLRFKHRLLQSAGRNNVHMQLTRFYSLIPTTTILPDKSTSFQLVRRFLPLTEHESSSPATQKPTNGPYSDPKLMQPRLSHTNALRHIFNVFLLSLHNFSKCLPPSRFTTKILYAFMFTPTPASRPAPLILLILLTTRCSLSP
jgi:hypothetical protein